MDPIFHVATRADWDEAAEAGAYRRSTLGRSLEEVGFVHCSTIEQVCATADAVFAGVDEPLVLLMIDPARVGAPVVHEDLHGTGERYPHVYGEIPAAAVVRVDPFDRSDGGGFRLPGGLR